ncbi:MAG: site-specific DNA-methyltransferase [bacterium]|nr:site-specific DNA-methyltransferase [bacterium]
MIDLHHADNMAFMAGLEDEAFPAIITDPPYGISMMGQKWDYNVPSIETFAEMLRVTKPGGIMLCFAGARTQHRMGVNIEDAGWRLCDTLMWIFGSGMGMALKIDLAIDKAAGAEREVVGAKYVTNCARAQNDGYARIGGKDGYNSGKAVPGFIDITTPTTESAKKWDGWFSPRLKPSYEPIILAQRPLDGTYANNVQKHGCGALHFEGVRIPTEEKLDGGTYGGSNRETDGKWEVKNGCGEYKQPTGRYPSHLLIDDHVAEVIDAQSGYSKSPNNIRRSYPKKNRAWNNENKYREGSGPKDSGGASRYFQRINFEEEDKICYCPKAPQKEVNYGLEESNTHPTIKPLSLMRWLVRLAKLPENTTVFDPFGGCFSTMWACIKEGVDGVSCEREKEYYLIGKKRIEQAKLDYEKEQKQTKLFPDFEGEKVVKPKPKQVGLFDE